MSQHLKVVPNDNKVKEAKQNGTKQQTEQQREREDQNSEN